MKTIEEIRTALEEIFSEGLNLQLFIGTKEGEQVTYTHANLSDDATEAICVHYINALRVFFENEHLSTHPLTAMDHRGDVLLMYDFAEPPAEFAEIAALQTDDPNRVDFSFDTNDLSRVKSLVIRIASAKKSVLFFKKFYPVSLVKRDQILLIKSDTRFGLLESDILKVSVGFEMMLLDGEFYINNFDSFEKAFSFKEISERSMQATVQAIMATGIVNDAKGHLAALRGSKKDILRAANSPVFALEAETVLEFARTHARIGLRVVDGRLELSSVNSVKQLYKLLNDDFLASGLTQIEYETLAKNRL